jgi:hypothetical protein
MRRGQAGPRVLILGLVALASAGPAPGHAADAGAEAVSADVSRWERLLATTTATDDIWKDVKEGSATGLARVRQALADDRTLLALLRLAQVRENLYAAAYLEARTADERRDPAAFESEWRRMGVVLKDDMARRPAGGVEGIRPVALRAMAEAAQAKLPVYYRASLEYGRSTTPDSGLFYLGAAQAQRDFVDLARRVSARSAPPPPSVPALMAGLDSLQSEILAAYRPPASVEKHPEFITVSALVKEGRELAAAGAQYGALLKYLQAAIRSASLGTAAGEPAAVAAELQAFEARLAAPGVDHSLGRLLLEYARADLAEHASDGAAISATAIARNVLPRYFAALEPPPSVPAAAPATVTVTLVRWPYT